MAGIIFPITVTGGVAARNYFPIPVTAAVAVRGKTVSNDNIRYHSKTYIKTYIFSRTIMEGQRRCEGIRVELIVRGEALGFVKDELL